MEPRRSAVRIKVVPLKYQEAAETFVMDDRVIPEKNRFQFNASQEEGDVIVKFHTLLVWRGFLVDAIRPKGVE
jgi:hypothetical protein